MVVTGGVLSGLGKGVTAASLGFLFSEDHRIVPIKLDGYLNTDPGTMNPVEHGEVFVLDDGFEVDMDFGHYERFLGVSCGRNQSMTMGKVYQEIQNRERNGDYLGKTVQMIPHVTDLIQEKILSIGEETGADIVLIEVGGTVGDLENDLYLEALRQLKTKVYDEDIVFIHLTYVPVPFGVKEQKTKPTQQSVSLLHQRGIWPEMIIGRCGDYLSETSIRKIALFSDIPEEAVFSAPDVDNIYRLPEIFAQQDVKEQLSQQLGLPLPSTGKLELWDQLLDTREQQSLTITIAGKYTDLEDSYASVVEALRHCAFNLGCELSIEWIETSGTIDWELIKRSDGVIVPGGFGTRGVEGKIAIIAYVREQGIPFLGICYGLQLAVVEFARHVCGIKDAMTMEVEPHCSSPVITLLDEQEQVVTKGGTMRLGAYQSVLHDGIIHSYYQQLHSWQDSQQKIVSERHRHRFEVNPDYVERLTKQGLHIAGYSVERQLVEFIELPQETHPYFVATQAHPELKSRLERPAPLFFGLVEAASNHASSRK